MARLGDICKFQSGGTPSKSEVAYFNGDIPWITTVALNGGLVSEENAVEWITEKAIEKSAAKIVPANSVMVGTRVGVGKVAINKVPMSTSQDIISLLDIDESKWSKEFICKFLLGKGTYLNSQARGATIKGIKIETLAGLQLPDIPIEQQCKIAMVIETVDNLIALRREQLAKLDRLVKSRFIELFGDIHAPSEWEKMPWSELVTIQNGRVYKNILVESGGYPVYGTGGEMARASDYLCPENTIIVGRKGTINNPLLVKEKFWNVDTAFGVIVGNQLHYQYFYNFCRMFDFSTLNKQAVLPSTTKADLLKIEMAVPPMELQEQFAAFVEQTDKSKLAIQQSLDKLELLKKSLMQEYFG